MNAPRAAKPRRRTPATQDAADTRSERLEALHQQLADGVAAIRDGAAWRTWLDTAAKFHQYSFNNQILLAAQKPDATLVAGYQAWQGMGRQVRKGEKALWVLAPVTTRRPTPGQPVDVDQLTEPATTTDPDPAGAGADWTRARVVGFRGAAVFDVSQTDGDPLPVPPRPQLLAGHAPAGLWDTLTEVITAHGFTVTRCPDPSHIGGANGITDYLTRTVTVRADVDDAQRTVTSTV